LLAVFILLAVFVGDYEVSEGQANVYLGWAPSLGMLALCLVYFVVMEAVAGKTLGKWILKTKVVNGRGETASWGQSIGRNALRIVDSLPFLYLVGFIAVVASKDKQRLGDMASRTYVVRG